MIRHFAEILPLRFGAQTDFFAAKSGQASLLRRTNRSSLVAEGVRTDCGRFTAHPELSVLSAMCSERPIMGDHVVRQHRWTPMPYLGGLLILGSPGPELRQLQNRQRASPAAIRGGSGARLLLTSGATSSRRRRKETQGGFLRFRTPQPSEPVPTIQLFDVKDKNGNTVRIRTGHAFGRLD
jgi:hypothetical protein